MSKCENNWQYVEQYPVETETLSSARRMSLECGIEPVSRATAAYLSSFSVTSASRSILEIGTGVGVSALSLLRHNTSALITSIDIEPEFHVHAKGFLAKAGVGANRTRLVTGDAQQILPRLNRSSYDLVLIDANPSNLLEYFEQSLTIVRQGGSIIIPNALNRGAVADPAARDDLTVALRDILNTVAESPAILPHLAQTGNGVLTLTRTAD